MILDNPHFVGALFGKPRASGDDPGDTRIIRVSSL